MGGSGVRARCSLSVGPPCQSSDASTPPSRIAEAEQNGGDGRPVGVEATRVVELVLFEPLARGESLEGIWYSELHAETLPVVLLVSKTTGENAVAPIRLSEWTITTILSDRITFSQSVLLDWQ